MKFSIIIPTYNRDEDLEECLKSLKEKSSYENEIIVLYNLNEKTKACESDLYKLFPSQGTVVNPPKR